jgi:hypothetical protein
MKHKFICSQCKRDNVTLDATAEFNEDTQRWELASTFQQAFCHDCDGYAYLKKVPIKTEVKS